MKWLLGLPSFRIPAATYRGGIEFEDLADSTGTGQRYGCDRGAFQLFHPATENDTDVVSHSPHFPSIAATLIFY